MTQRWRLMGKSTSLRKRTGWWKTAARMPKQSIARLEIMINADSRKIHNAVVTDTINYNQHTFLRDADDNVIVDVYEAVLNNGTWEKGEKGHLH